MVSFGGQCFENAESETRWLTCQNIKQLGNAITIDPTWKSHLMMMQKCTDLHSAICFTNLSMRTILRHTVYKSTYAHCIALYDLQICLCALHSAIRFTNQSVQNCMAPYILQISLCGPA
jgi:hypothetical protein